MTAVATPADLVSVASPPSFSLSGMVARFVEVWRVASADRRSALDLGHLDGETLRDIGVEADEITRLHAGQQIVPRTWQA